ncbi:hypothetical protein [Ralstonia pseudosolanacearum]
MFKEGGAGASVRPISPRDNMSAGACIGNACVACLTEPVSESMLEIKGGSDHCF